MKGKLKHNEPLAPHTSWHVGGQAERYYSPYDIPDLIEFLNTLPKEEPITWLGLGSNVLIPDEGIRGTVIHTLGMLPSVPSELSPGVIRAETSIPSAKLAKFCAKKGLVGGEFFAGIPGTIGGALFMNAGAFGGETWKVVEAVEVINRKGERSFRNKSDYEIEYRKVTPKMSNEEWFLAAHCRFEAGDPKDTEDKIKALLRKRAETQPIGVFSCGSVFKNPPNDFAGRLIESSHLKGFSIGGAQISPKHANFIINDGKANASHILQLIQHIQEVVLKTQGVLLETEVRLLKS